jgi:hypothetical protein
VFRFATLATTRKTKVGAWPIELIVKNLDRKVPKQDLEAIVKIMAAGGFGKSLINFLAPLYAVADNGTFFEGALRIISLASNAKRKILGMVDWNCDEEWKSNLPEGAKHKIYFLTNSFGDLLGVPVDAKLELLHDYSSIFSVDTYRVEESSKPWGEIMRMALSKEQSMDVFVGRRKDHDWAKKTLGPVKPSESYSWDVPPALGGAEDIDNVRIGPLSLNVSFTLQLFAESRRAKKKPRNG